MLQGWINSQGWKFWLIVLVAIIVLIWIIWGGRVNQQFVGLEPLMPGSNIQLNKETLQAIQTMRSLQSDPTDRHFPVMDSTEADSDMSSESSDASSNTSSDDSDIDSEEDREDQSDRENSPRRSPGRSPGRSPERSPRRSPGRSPGRSPERSPERRGSPRSKSPSPRRGRSPTPKENNPNSQSIRNFTEYSVSKGPLELKTDPSGPSGPSGSSEKSGKGLSPDPSEESSTSSEASEGSAGSERSVHSTGSSTMKLLRRSQPAPMNSDVEVARPPIVEWKNGAQKYREKECRRILESIYQKPFPSYWPDFLKNPETGSNLELDCYNADLKIALEHQGEQHYHFPNAWHLTDHKRTGEEKFRENLRRDIYKRKVCQEQGIYLINVPYYVPFKRLEAFIRENLPKGSSSPRDLPRNIERDLPGPPGSSGFRGNRK